MSLTLAYALWIVWNSGNASPSTVMFFSHHYIEVPCYVAGKLVVTIMRFKIVKRRK